MFLYAIGTAGKRQKIGFSKNPERRLKTLQTANSEPLILHYKFEITESKARKFEAKIHREYAHKRIKGEWFSFTPEEVVDQMTFFEITKDSIEILL